MITYANFIYFNRKFSTISI